MTREPDLGTWESEHQVDVGGVWPKPAAPGKAAKEGQGWNV